VLVAAFVVLGFMATSSAEKSAMIEKYNNNKESIIKEIIELDNSKEFIMAEAKLNPYLNLMPTDSELLALREKIKADAKKDKEEKKAKVEQEAYETAQRQKNEAAENEQRQKNEAAENARQAANSKIVALSYQCNSNSDVESAVLNARANQEAFNLNVALNIIKSTPGCGVGSQGPKVSKGEWELIVNGNAFVALRAKNTQKFGYQYVYGITTINAYENPQ
jgi:hypothetical protein